MLSLATIIKIFWMKAKFCALCKRSKLRVTTQLCQNVKQMFIIANLATQIQSFERSMSKKSGVAEGKRERTRKNHVFLLTTLPWFFIAHSFSSRYWTFSIISLGRNIERDVFPRNVLHNFCFSFAMKMILCNKKT